MSEQKIQGKIASPDTQSWIEYSYKLEQDVPNRFEDAAKFLATMISLSLTITITAIDRLKIETFPPVLLMFILFTWLIALILAFIVLFPEKYRYSSISADSIKEMQKKIIRDKKRVFIAATLLYIMPFCVLIFTYALSVINK